MLSNECVSHTTLAETIIILQQDGGVCHSVIRYLRPVWTPHTQTDRDTIEKVQKRAARWNNARWDSSIKKWSRSYDESLAELPPSRRALRKKAKNPTCSTWDDFTRPIPRVVRGTILRQQLHVQYVGRFYVRPNDVKSPRVSWDSISYVAGFYVD